MPKRILTRREMQVRFFDFCRRRWETRNDPLYFEGPIGDLFFGKTVSRLR
jgi:hypothetical protein